MDSQQEFSEGFDIRYVSDIERYYQREKIISNFYIAKYLDENDDPREDRKIDFIAHFNGEGYTLLPQRVQPGSMGWEELNLRVQEILSYPECSKSCIRLAETKVTRESIEEIIKKGWTIVKKRLDKKGEGIADLVKKQITLSRIEKSGGYGRDVILMHEIAHALFPEFSDSHMGSYDLPDYDNCLMIEWKARKMRANPELLKAAINGFGLQPYCYDSISAEAFPNAKYYPFEQIDFPFARTMGIRMDAP